jgi:hypothetical protein
MNGGEEKEGRTSVLSRFGKKASLQTSILLEELRHGRYQLAFTFSFT